MRCRGSRIHWLCSDKGPSIHWIERLPLSSDRQHLSYGDCLEVRGEIIRTVLCCIVYWKLCIVIGTLRWAVLRVLWIGFYLTGPISLCVDSCVYVFFALYCHTAYMLYYCNTVGWTWWDWSLILEHLPSVLWHCWLGHLIRKNPSPIWPIMCSVGRSTLLNLLNDNTHMFTSQSLATSCNDLTDSCYHSPSATARDAIISGLVEKTQTESEIFQSEITLLCVCDSVYTCWLLLYTLSVCLAVLRWQRSLSVCLSVCQPSQPWWQAVLWLIWRDVYERVSCGRQTCCVHVTHVIIIS